MALRRRAAASIVGRDLALALGLDQRKAIAANAGRLWLYHTQQRAAGDCGIRGRAARLQHLDRRKRGHGVRGRHHRVHGVDRRAAGEMETPHAKLLIVLFSGSRGRRYMTYSCPARQWLVYQTWPPRFG